MFKAYLTLIFVCMLFIISCNQNSTNDNAHTIQVETCDKKEINDSIIYDNCYLNYSRYSVNDVDYCRTDEEKEDWFNKSNDNYMFLFKDGDLKNVFKNDSSINKKRLIVYLNGRIIKKYKLYLLFLILFEIKKRRQKIIYSRLSSNYDFSLIHYLPKKRWFLLVNFMNFLPLSRNCCKGMMHLHICFLSHKRRLFHQLFIKNTNGYWFKKLR